MQRHPLLFASFVCASLGAAAAFAPACAAATNSTFDTGGGGQGAGTSPSGVTTGGQGGEGGDIIAFDGGSDAPTCGGNCSSDFHAVLDCNGNVVEQCSGTNGCDSTAGSCVNACQAAVHNKQSVGCEYYATFMDQFTQGSCFAVFVANTWDTPVHLNVDYAGAPLPIASFTRIPSGSGAAISYQPYNEATGLPPGEVAVLFLSGTTGQQQPGFAPCPIPAAIPQGAQLFQKSGIGNSFHISSDVPVVAYEISPYGGGSAAITAGSLLLPTSAWDTNYIAVNAYAQDVANPSMNIIAMENNTQVTMLPVASVQGGGGIPSGPANQPLVFMLNKGQQAQLSQPQELTGSVIQSDKPVGFMAGHACMNVPKGVPYCDHAEQMIPPVKALGSEYVGVMYRPRKGEQAIWRVVGAVDGTQLAWSTPVGGPATLNRGQVAEFITGAPFVVKSQDKDHPFMLFTYMSGSTWQPGMDGYGDADFVISVPPDQYMSRYVFFTDPTYPETNLVLVRARTNGAFEDVNLDCAGVVQGWQPVGDYEWARVDLITGNFQPVGNCSNGRHEITSKGRFGLWIWGWGTPLTGNDGAGVFTQNVSYGYPGGMNVQPINAIVVPPTPK